MTQKFSSRGRNTKTFYDKPVDSEVNTKHNFNTNEKEDNPTLYKPDCVPYRETSVNTVTKDFT